MVDCQVCLACGADPNTLDTSKRTPLLQLLSYYSDHPSEADSTTVRLLIPSGPSAAGDALLRSTDRKSRNALHYATADSAALQHVLSLLSPDAQDLVHAADCRGWKPIHWACYHQNAASLKLLIAADAELE